MWFYHWITSPNDADGMANSVDPDQTAWFQRRRCFNIVDDDDNDNDNDNDNDHDHDNDNDDNGH